jgi:acyl-CoA reductase-like NAD-dependent aldehyde dehydrogenase
MSSATGYVRDHFLIGGRPAKPESNEELAVISPSSEEWIGSVPLAATQDVDRAVAAARAAFDDGPWPRMPAAERVEILRAAHALLVPQTAEIARVVTSEMGQPITISTEAITPRAIDTILRFAGLAGLLEEEVRPGSAATAVVLREPVGVVAAIAPWNGPLANAVIKIAPALVAGCTVVYKPAPETPLDAYYLVEALTEAGLPDGVLNLVPAGREVGEHLVRHPGVDKVSFTGSTAAGRRVGAICGEHLKRVTLELGGKSAAIVLEDADLAVAGPALQTASFGNAGQVCASFSRILAPRSRYDEVVEMISERAASIVVGDPFEPETTLGPLVAERQRDRVEGYIASGLEQGARIVRGGGRPAHLERGWFVEPTVFRDVRPEMSIAREEIFGPVVAVIPYDSEDEAVAIANDSDYGLHGGVFTGDPAHGLEIARRVRTGTFTVNGYLVNFDAPFGGVKCSGLGREFSTEGLLSFTEPKTVNFPNGVEVPGATGR